MLNYIALLMIVVSVTAIFYLFIYIHELPYEAAKHRNHPLKDAIYVACWLSLFTLHALWPIVFIWALSHDETRDAAEVADEATARIDEIERRLASLEQRPAVKGGAKS